MLTNSGIRIKYLGIMNRKAGFIALTISMMSLSSCLKTYDCECKTVEEDGSISDIRIEKIKGIKRTAKETCELFSSENTIGPKDVCTLK